MQTRIIFNGSSFSKHPKQKYYYATIKQKKKSLHRAVWEYHKGEIPKGYHIHHIDGNQFNNEIDNLELVKGRDHLIEHMKKRVADNPEFFKSLAEKGRKHAAEWHSSEEGIEWHKKHAKKIGFGHKTYGKKNCDYCGRKFTMRRKCARFCHNNCKSANRRQLIRDGILDK